MKRRLFEPPAGGGARSRRSAAWLFAAAALALAGCSSICIDGAFYPDVTCQASGSATLSAPAELIPAAPPHVLGAGSCLDLAGHCTAGPSFDVSIRADGDGAAVTPGAPGGLVVDVVFKNPQAATGTVELPSPEVDVSGVLDVAALPYYEPLTLVSGSVTVLSSDAATFRATFVLTVAAASGETFTLSGGTVDATCQAIQRCG